MSTLLGWYIAKVLHCEKLRNKPLKSYGTNRQKVAEFYCEVIYF